MARGRSLRRQLDRLCGIGERDLRAIAPVARRLDAHLGAQRGGQGVGDLARRLLLVGMEAVVDTRTARAPPPR